MSLDVARPRVLPLLLALNGDHDAVPSHDRAGHRTVADGNRRQDSLARSGRLGSILQSKSPASLPLKIPRRRSRPLCRGRSPVTGHSSFPRRSPPPPAVHAGKADDPLRTANSSETGLVSNWTSWTSSAELVEIRHLDADIAGIPPTRRRTDTDAHDPPSKRGRRQTIRHDDVDADKFTRTGQDTCLRRLGTRPHRRRAWGASYAGRDAYRPDGRTRPTRRTAPRLPAGRAGRWWLLAALAAGNAAR
jgi:hypothetical protein